MEILIEMIRDILCANHLCHRRLVPAPCLFECERPVERVRVFHCYDRGQSPSVLTDREPLDNVEFLGVRRAEGIDVVILAAREPYRINHERVPAFVMADGFAEPGRLHIFRMLVGEINATHEMIALPYYPNLLRRLDEIHGLEKKELARNAPRPAARLRGKGNRHLAAEHLFIRLLHVLCGPGFQNRILRIRDRVLEVATCITTAVLTLAGIRIARIGLHWPVSGPRRRVELKIPEIRVPADISWTKLRDGIRSLCGREKRRNKGDHKKASADTAYPLAAAQC